MKVVERKKLVGETAGETEGARRATGVSAPKHFAVPRLLNRFAITAAFQLPDGISL